MIDMEDEVRGTFKYTWKIELCTRFQPKIPKRRNHLIDLGVEGGITEG
jgi:hypothetical protein